MRLFTASLATETNTFSPIPTSLASFKENTYYPPGSIRRRRPCAPGRSGSAGGARRGGWTLVEGSCFWAEPSGTTAKAAYEGMRDEILGQLKAALPVDGVILGLHGAMVAYGYDDCEGDLLERVRALAGPNVPIGVEYDPHSHLTKKRVANADVSICSRSSRTPISSTAPRNWSTSSRAGAGEVKPVMSVYDCRMIGSFPTTIQPMRGFVDRIKSWRARTESCRSPSCTASPMPTCRSSAPRSSSSPTTAGAGDRLAAELGREFVGMRGKTLPTYHTIDGAIDKALGANQGTVIIADPSDNAGGGAPSDSTPILHSLLARRVEDAAIGPIWDPMAVRLCFDAGEGARFKLRFGGKTAVTSGLPVDAEVEVLKLVRDNFQTFGKARSPSATAPLSAPGASTWC